MVWDPADGGDDHSISIWRGNTKIEQHTFSANIVEGRAKAFELQAKYGIPNSQIVIDSVGNHEYHYFEGCYKFMGQANPIGDENTKYSYQYLRHQCYYKLAQMVNNGLLRYENIDTFDNNIAELLPYRRETRNGKLYLPSKDVIKKEIGQSPNMADTDSMFMIKYLTTYAQSNETVEREMSVQDIMRNYTDSIGVTNYGNTIDQGF